VCAMRKLVGGCGCGWVISGLPMFGVRFGRSKGFLLLYLFFLNCISFFGLAVGTHDVCMQLIFISLSNDKDTSLNFPIGR